MASTEWHAGHRLSCAALLLITFLLAGCGNSRTAVPSLTQPLAAKGTRTLGGKLGSSRDDFALLVPTNWDDDPIYPRSPVVAIVASGAAVIALSRYPSTVPPVGFSQLQQDKSALLMAVRAKDPRFRLLSATTAMLKGRPAVELAGIERVSGRLRRVLSTHLYLAQGELVLDEYAPVNQFAGVERAFERARSSLRVFAPTAGS